MRAFGEREGLPIINDYWERADFPVELVPKLAELGVPLVAQARGPGRLR